MDELTPRQIDVLRGLSEGLRMSEIAERLGLAVISVSNTAVAMYRRLGVTNAAGAVGEGYRRGILRVEPKLPGLASIAGAAVCTCAAIGTPHVQGVGGCDG
jgi:DNA-binding CsgD family transcriptional regulator